MAKRLTDEEMVDRIKHLIHSLSRECDSIQVLVTRVDEESDLTVSLDLGKGNYYSRLGMVSDWLIKQKKLTCNEVK